MPSIKAALALTLGIALIVQPSAQADARNSARSEALVKQGQAFELQGKHREALAAFNAAAKADPRASLPLLLAAEALLATSNHKWGESRTQLRNAAQVAAREALRRDPTAERNLELMSHLDDTADPALNHQPLGAAAQALVKGEVQWERGDFDGEWRQVKRALQLDSHYAQAWIGAGRNQLARGNLPEAVRSLRRATEIEPLLARGWYLLAVSLARQGDQAAAEAAALACIAAQPDASLAWVLLAHIRDADAPEPKQFGLIRKSSATIDPVTGHIRLAMDAALLNAESPDSQAWTSYAATVAFDNKTRMEGDHSKTPFQTELRAWRTALADADQQIAWAGDALRDPDLLAIRAFEQAGQLEPAVLLLLYKEGYRADLEAWKLANPDGIAKFTQAWQLRP